LSVQTKQVKGDEHDPGRSALQLVLKHREIGEATCRWDDHFAIDDGGARIALRGIRGDLAEAFGPVVAPARKNLDPAVLEMNLDAVAIELDFVNPARPIGDLIDRGCQGRFDEAGISRLDAEDLPALHCHALTPRD
jgi:hypothetical protein